MRVSVAGVTLLSARVSGSWSSVTQVVVRSGMGWSWKPPLRDLGKDDKGEASRGCHRRGDMSGGPLAIDALELDRRRPQLQQEIICAEGASRAHTNFDSDLSRLSYRRR